MEISQIFTIGLVAANVLFSYQGFSKPGFMDRYGFQVGPVRDGKDYIRLLSAGFLHVNWMHLFFNMFALYSFGQMVGSTFGLLGFILIYFASLLGGNLLPLYFRRNDSNYRAVGASGAVSGVVFALTLIYPQLPMLFPPGPIWLICLGFLAYTLYGIKNRTGNIGHEAHLGGALVGMVLAFVLQPATVIANWWVALLLLVPTAIFLYIAVSNPAWLLFGGKKSKPNASDNQYWSRNSSRASAPGVGREAYTGKKIIDLKPSKKANVSPQEELDMLLDKVRLKGMDKLSRKEKTRLEELSKGLS